VNLVDAKNMTATVIEPVTMIDGVAVPFDYSSVDTDAIFPVSADELARREGFGKALFARWRADPDFILNRPVYADARVLVAGPDFGVGSSRETAVWALTGAGFRAVIAPSFGDIFRSNCARNRLLAATIDVESCRDLQDALAADPGAHVRIDILAATASGAGVAFGLGIGQFASDLLTGGIDELDLLAQRQEGIDRLLAGRKHLTRPTTDVAGSDPSNAQGDPKGVLA
jgi:3-isopropylmalate/(R)-2-methylmalate dehydratase small subunit